MRFSTIVATLTIGCFAHVAAFGDTPATTVFQKRNCCRIAATYDAHEQICECKRVQLSSDRDLHIIWGGVCGGLPSTCTFQPGHLQVYADENCQDVVLKIDNPYPESAPAGTVDRYKALRTRRVWGSIKFNEEHTPLHEMYASPEYGQYIERKLRRIVYDMRRED